MKRRFLPGWHPVERGLLWVTLGVCTFIASEPLRERVTGWANQNDLEARWRDEVRRAAARTAKSAPAPGHTLPSRSKHPGAKTKDRAPVPLWPLARLSCSKIHLDALVVEGTGAAQLRSGPGHEIGTSWPGGPNCVIAAHRNAFGWWFYHLNSLEPGDFVTLQSPSHKFIYRVATSRTVSVNDISILHCRAKTAPRLTLYTCTLPKTEQRLVVIANLEHADAT